MLLGPLIGHAQHARPRELVRTQLVQRSFTGGLQLPRQASVSRIPARRVVVAEALSNRGKRFDPSNVDVKRILGEGSYGAAYEVKHQRNKLRIRKTR